MSSRREFITLLGGAVAARPLTARAQQPERMRRIGVLGPSLSNPFPSTVYQAFLAQLRELGFSEGQNLVAEYQAMDDARGPFVATIELMRSQPDLVVALGVEVVLQALVGASGSVPIVFIAINYDPIRHRRLAQGSSQLAGSFHPGCGAAHSGALQGRARAHDRRSNS
jgi:putative tryptophan/tyrosine transport system substrate-binding protein